MKSKLTPEERILIQGILHNIDQTTPNGLQSFQIKSKVPPFIYAGIIILVIGYFWWILR